MKNLKLIFTLLSIFICSKHLNAQQVKITVAIDSIISEPNILPYNNSLKISDFEGEPEVGSDAVAMAYTGIDLKFEGSEKNGIISIHVNLSATFDKDKSWFLDKAKNAYILSHEQLHFDITAKHAYLLAKEIQTFRFTKNVQNEIISLHEKYKKLNDFEQEAYDDETNHGINKDVQEKWNKKIALELTELIKNFKSN